MRIVEFGRGYGGRWRWRAVVAVPQRLSVVERLLRALLRLDWPEHLVELGSPWGDDWAVLRPEPLPTLAPPEAWRRELEEEWRTYLLVERRRELEEEGRPVPSRAPRADCLTSNDERSFAPDPEHCDESTGARRGTDPLEALLIATQRLADEAYCSGDPDLKALAGDALKALERIDPERMDGRPIEDHGEPYKHPTRGPR